MKLVSHLLEVLTSLLLAPVARLLRIAGDRPARALVVGWWGSETVGDIAILGQLLADCAQRAPATRLTVVSFHPETTQESLRELGRQDVEVLPLGARSGWALLRSRSILFGGGPLMDSPSLPFWAVKALAARLAGAQVMLYGCGIGPVRWRVTRLAISSLLRVATHVVLRDEYSRRFSEELTGRGKAIVAFDPAHDYVAGLPGSSASRDPRQLALVLRFPTRRYLSAEGEEAASERLLGVVTAALHHLTRTEPHLRFVGLVMHTGFREDDHLAYARLRDRLDDPGRLVVAPGRHSVAHVAHVLASSGAALTVRFHGLIFALATGTPLVAVDYSGPAGKVRAAAEQAGVTDAVVAWDDLDGPRLAAALHSALEGDTPAPRSGFPLDRQRRLEALASALGAR